MHDYPATVLSPARRSGSRSVTIFVAIIAFILGAALVAWAATRGYLDRVLPEPTAHETAAVTLAPPDDDATLAARTAPAAAGLAAIGTVEGRVAMLEDRISRIDYQTEAAAGHAARAEGLLVAFAARRMIDRGEPLRFVADQLRLRFMDAQPNSVETVIAFSRKPVTIDELTARLEALSPELTVTDQRQSLWERLSHELGAMFEVRRDAPTLADPAARVERAKLMLTARRIDGAISEVERLPGAEAGQTWIADARRYKDVQQALDLLETTAMLEPGRLHDADGHQMAPPPAAPAATSGN